MAVALEQDRILITPVEEEKQSGIAGVSYTYYTGYVNDDTLVPLLKRKGIEFEGYIPDSSSSIVEFLLAYVLPVSQESAGLCFSEKIRYDRLSPA